MSSVEPSPGKTRKINFSENLSFWRTIEGGADTSPFPEPWNYLLSFKIHFKKSIKVTQSPRVPRVRGGDPSGVAPGKVEGFFSAPGHPWKLFY